MRQRLTSREHSSVRQYVFSSCLPRSTRSREGRYLLRTNLVEEDPAKLWGHYLLLVAVEEAFKNLKGDLAIRPVFHRFIADLR